MTKKGHKDISTTTTETTREEAPKEVLDNPLYGVAMLKIAMELKKPNAGALEDILKGVLGRMNLSEDAFRSYLERNGGLLKTIAQKKFT